MEENRTFDLNYYRDLAHDANKKWWVDTDKPCPNRQGQENSNCALSCEVCHGTGYQYKDQPTGQKLMLAVSELSESLEGHRKGLMDDKLPHRLMAEVELVDFLIRCFDLAGGKNWDLTAANPHGLAFMGRDLNEIANKVHKFTHSQLTPDYSECLLCITGLLTDCYRYKQFKQQQERSLAYALHNALALGHDRGFKLQAAFDEKMAYNAVRADHRVENRVKAGGKKY